MTLQFICKHFRDLTVFELYDIMALRQTVFVVEQNCPYLDADGKDLDSWQLMVYNADNQELVANTRLLAKGISYPEYASIGRVVNAPSVRGLGVGKKLMEESLRQMSILFPNEPIKIGAQSYLLGFYQSLGFEPTAHEYLEDGIPHTSMIWKGKL